MDFFDRNVILDNTTVYRYNVKYKDGEYYVFYRIIRTKASNKI